MLTAALLCLAQSPPPPVHVPRAQLVVHLVDAAGELRAEGWVVRVRPAHADGSPRASNERRALVDPNSGTATFGGLHPGDYVVSASHATGEAGQATPLAVRHPAEYSLAVLVPSPPPERCLYVRVSQPIAGRDLALEAVAEDGAVWPFEALPEYLDLYVARGVEPGTYRVRSVDTRFRGEAADVRPGQNAMLVLAPLPRTGPGHPELQLVFRCAESDAELAPTALEIGLPTAEHVGLALGGALEGPRAVELPKGPFAVRGVSRAGATLVAHFQDRPTFVADLAPLPEGDPLAYSFRVPRGAELTGRVVDEQGRPLAGCAIALERVAPPPHQRPFQVTLPDPKQRGVVEHDHRPAPRLIQTETQADGTFACAGLDTGEWQVTARPSPFRALHGKAAVGASGTRAELPVLTAEGDSGADVLLRWGPRTQRPSTLRLQVAGGPWLTAAPSAPLVHRPEGTLLRLRGLPPGPATLLVEPSRPKLRGAADGVEPTRVELTLTPAIGPPVEVALER